MKRTMVPQELGRQTEHSLWSDPFFALQRGINTMFDDMWRGIEVSPSFLGTRFPNLDVHDEEKTILVTVELPGMDTKDVEIGLSDGILTIKGEKKSETNEKNERGMVSERRYGQFARSISVGSVDENAAKASFENGILTVTLPKTEKPKETGRKIPITTK